MTGDRWPTSVYSAGQEPDYRFSLANERTFLAWIRTALALVAGAVALQAVPTELPDVAGRLLAVGLAALSLACAVGGWIRWTRAERAMRQGHPLPAFGFAVGIVVAVSALAASAGILVVAT